METCINKVPVIEKGRMSELFCSEQMKVCGGEIHNVTRDGKVIDCVCKSCGKSYGKDYLRPSRIKFVESFNPLTYIG